MAKCARTCIRRYTQKTKTQKKVEKGKGGKKGEQGEGTGTRPDYLVNRDDKKLRGRSEKTNSQKLRNSCSANGGDVGAHGHLT